MNRQGTKVPVTNLRSLLHSLVLNTEGDDVTVRQLLTAIGRRAYGPVLLLLGFIAVSPLTVIPGANWFVATVTLIFALQIVIGRKTPWLPKRALDFSFKRNLLVQGVGASEKYAYMVDALVRPRLHFLTEAPFVQVVGLICVLASLITYPLGLVPLGPLLPGLTVLLFGLGLTARDGVVVLLATLSLVAAMFIVFHMLPQLIGLWPF
ncbi:MAG: exopolysaccharide biosynthesis protein [Hyphomonas sp.]|uniref:exopolysaccharide biosynthesis protein n=1 Tax=Hyphomonas sp. TaxID=87 RepID=UPI0017E0F383|nr:exopolysaccharide biosynthesis protein [Hyphomonas sp.]MBU3919617.1 exopolysaccharide biosynthesis protein [Alphaproteobacteria bacterium]MBA3068710.1 exopolysaccharide biosynthesis protein [Hyphomonas sp.]MBU4063626.1 exopolysaccharide biosynthesis protein [Alphaproteobacteria bacterium]MBU4165749.1 exopolysaccharide biosynthesis protein [Alphaproteobacteria bacterium]MBU4568356.1 exopolysaccharide biosynthesis protein [Alphaproteobacteria bacterium]